MKWWLGRARNFLGIYRTINILKTKGDNQKLAEGVNIAAIPFFLSFDNHS